MAGNVVEDHFAVQAALVVAVSTAMLYAGEEVGDYLRAHGLPYAGTVGLVLGAALVFVPFALVYRRSES